MSLHSAPRASSRMGGVPPTLTRVASRPGCCGVRQLPWILFIGAFAAVVVWRTATAAASVHRNIDGLRSVWAGNRLSSRAFPNLPPLADHQNATVELAKIGHNFVVLDGNNTIVANITERSLERAEWAHSGAEKKHLIHFYHSDFCLGQANMGDIAFLRDRLELFTTFTLPSMVNQTVLPYAWAIYVEALMPPEVLAGLKAAISGHSWIDLVVIHPRRPGSIHVGSEDHEKAGVGWISRRLLGLLSKHAAASLASTTDNILVVQTGIDIDDGIAVYYTAWVQNTLRHVAFRSDDPDATEYTIFPQSGFMWQLDRHGQLGHFTHMPTGWGPYKALYLGLTVAVRLDKWREHVPTRWRSSHTYLCNPANLEREGLREVHLRNSLFNNPGRRCLRVGTRGNRNPGYLYVRSASSDSMVGMNFGNYTAAIEGPPFMKELGVRGLVKMYGLVGSRLRATNSHEARAEVDRLRNPPKMNMAGNGAWGQQVQMDREDALKRLGGGGATRATPLVDVKELAKMQRWNNSIHSWAKDLTADGCKCPWVDVHTCDPKNNDSSACWAKCCQVFSEIMAPLMKVARAAEAAGEAAAEAADARAATSNASLLTGIKEAMERADANMGAIRTLLEGGGGGGGAPNQRLQKDVDSVLLTNRSDSSSGDDATTRHRRLVIQWEDGNARTAFLNVKDLTAGGCKCPWVDVQTCDPKINDGSACWAKCCQAFSEAVRVEIMAPLMKLARAAAEAAEAAEAAMALERAGHLGRSPDVETLSRLGSVNVRTSHNNVPQHATIHFVNLAKRKDRRATMEGQLRRLFEVRPDRYSGWDWRRFDAQAPDDAAKQRYTPFAYGTMGCTLSHVAMLTGEDAAAAGQVTFVLEDDAKFQQTPEETWGLFDSFFQSRLAEDWDLLLLGYSPYYLQLQPTAVANVSQAFSAQTTIGYAVHPRFRQKLWKHWKDSLAEFPEKCGGADIVGYPGKGCTLAIDQLWKQFMRPDSGHKVYTVTPRMVNNDGSKSDIPEHWAIKTQAKTLQGPTPRKRTDVKAATPRPVVDVFIDAFEGEQRRVDSTIRNFVRKNKCSHVYLDVGSNIGVQIRKLYEPHKYTRASILPLFDKVLGKAPRCEVCSIGIEPNPKHAARLKKLVGRYAMAGAHVLMLYAAAAAHPGAMQLAVGKSKDELNDKNDWGAHLAGNTGNPEAGHTVTVRTVDVFAIIPSVDKSLREIHGSSRGASRILMKMDIEGAEADIITPLILSNAVCLVDSLFVEWHEQKKEFEIDTTHRMRLARDLLHSMFYAHLSEENQKRTGGVPRVEGRCRTALNDIDDETYLMDGQAWPEGTSVCGAPVGEEADVYKWYWPYSKIVRETSHADKNTSPPPVPAAGREGGLRAAAAPSSSSPPLSAAKNKAAVHNDGSKSDVKSP